MIRNKKVGACESCMRLEEMRRSMRKSVASRGYLEVADLLKYVGQTWCDLTEIPLELVREDQEKRS